MGMSRSRAFVSVALALGLGAASCVADDPEAITDGTRTTNLTGDEIILTAGLETVGDCDALLARLINEGLERVGPYGFGSGYFWGPGILEGDRDLAAAGDDSAGGPATTVVASEPSQGGADGQDGFSQTNTQEVDVDEADIVKTDGTRLIVVAEGTVRVLDITGSQPSLVHTIDIGDFGGGELFINGDQALLMGTSWSQVPIMRADAARSIRPEGEEITRITTIDLNDGTVGRTIEFVGRYLSAREADGSVRVVIAAGMGNFPWLYPSNPGAEDAAIEANKDLLRRSTIDDWLPAYRVVEDGDAVESGLLFDCDRTHLPMEFAGFGSIGILTVDADAGFTVTDSVGVITDGQTVYASTDRLTVATPRYPEWDFETGLVKDGEIARTALHNFDITDPVRATYMASGRVDGTLLNQYSLSEYDGFLRVATTRQVGTDWNDTVSAVVILAERDGALVETGRVDGLGKGEQIFAVRYQGDLAYVVTFRQTDPLYVIDLSDPGAPKARGELKIPGFSSYLHPLGEGLLLGVGQDATDQGRTTGAQMSLFDVTDPDNPVRIDTLPLGSKNSSSIVQWDARAFNYWSPTNTAIVPVESWDERSDRDGNTAKAVLVRVENRSLIDAGSVRHPPTRQCEGVYYTEDVDGVVAEEPPATTVPEPAADEDPPETTTIPVPIDAGGGVAPIAPEEWCWTWTPQILRTVVADGTLYTVSTAGVHSFDFATLTPGVWVDF